MTPKAFVVSSRLVTLLPSYRSQWGGLTGSRFWQGLVSRLLSYLHTLAYGAGRRIRTHGTFPFFCFQDSCFRPLSQSGKIKPRISAWLSYSIAFSITTAMITASSIPQIGENTHKQLQLITLQSLSTTNTMIKRPKKPIPRLSLLSLIMFPPKEKIRLMVYLFSINSRTFEGNK